MGGTQKMPPSEIIRRPFQGVLKGPGRIEVILSRRNFFNPFQGLAQYAPSPIKKV